MKPVPATRIAQPVPDFHLRRFPVKMMHSARAEIVIGPLQKQEKMKLFARRNGRRARHPFFGFLGGGRRRRPWHPPRQLSADSNTPALIIAPSSNFGRRICSLAVLISSGIFKRIGSIIGRPIAFRVCEKRINNRMICYNSMPWRSSPRSREPAARYTRSVSFGPGRRGRACAPRRLALGTPAAAR